MRRHPIILDCDLAADLGPYGYWVADSKSAPRKLFIMSDQVAAIQELNEEHSKVILKTGQEFVVIWNASRMMERL